MKFLRFLGKAAVALAAGALTSCGGGGGGGDGGGGGSAGPTGLNYSGNSNPAVITTSNAGAITANIVSTGEASSAGSVPSLSVAPPATSDSGMVDLGRRLHSVVRRAAAQPGPLDPRAPGITRAVALDEHVPCDSGEIHIVGTVSDNGIGTVSVRYIACRTGGTTASGDATMRIDAFDVGVFGPTDYTINFTRLILTGAGAAEISGSTRSRLDIPTRTETITENVVVQFASGLMTKSENLVYVDVYNDLFNPTSYTESVSGRVFHSLHGFVEISTPVPLFFGSLSQEFAQNGQLLLTGANGSSILVTALSPTTVSLGLDIDGGGVDRVVTLAWTELAGPVGANLADTDGDGMHDGWELAFGLNPNNAADASLDSDGDGASNLTEYQSGTRPNSNASAPPAVGLSLGMGDSPDPATVGGGVTYTITVSNTSSSAATNVVVTDTLPSGVNFVSATTSQGSCSAVAPTVTCTLGMVNGFNVATVTIVVTPTAEGLISNVASVTSGSFDPNPLDNSASSVTLVGVPASGLQGLIDAAAEGSTVLVPPGTYVGGLTFRGRNVALQSTGGPAVTFIQGSTATAVSIGPLGSIHGFTITGAGFGSGIEVSGTGTVISGNVFAGNNGGTSGFGAGIHGNTSSPVIRANVFRNNNCDNQFLSGVVVLVNTSSPRIFNNVFANNTCRAINMTLPQFNAPEIINNTFVGNRAAIRVDRRVPQLTQVYRNNIIVGNGIGLEVEFGSDADNPVWQNNLVFGNTTNYSGTAVLTGSNGNISAEPLFIDQPAGNYDLKAGSPAIGAGSLDHAPTTDFDGVARGGSIDIGAFEGP
jgi:uncharacterized repeat protein (TIGR01451 family)